MHGGSSNGFQSGGRPHSSCVSASHIAGSDGKSKRQHTGGPSNIKPLYKPTKPADAVQRQAATAASAKAHGSLRRPIAAAEGIACAVQLLKHLQGAKAPAPWQPLAWCCRLHTLIRSGTSQLCGTQPPARTKRLVAKHQHQLLGSTPCGFTVLRSRRRRPRAEHLWPQGASALAAASLALPTILVRFATSNLSHICR